jgi:pyruvate-ferredoxin/flavodoxin oxidoreductase
MLMGLGGEDDKDTKGRMAAHGAISDKDDRRRHHRGAAARGVHPQEPAGDRRRAANGMSVMAMAAHTGCNTVYGSTPPNNPHPVSLDELALPGRHHRRLAPRRKLHRRSRPAIGDPETVARRADDREKDVINPREYYEYVHFSDAVMTDQEILEMPKVWVVGGDGGMGDIGYQNMSKVILQNRPNVKAVMLDTQVYSNTGGQNSDSTPMLGGNDMNMFGTATQGKNVEKKTVAETFLAGHGSPFVAQISIANAPKLYRSIPRRHRVPRHGVPAVLHHLSAGARRGRRHGA